jgi:hypothetical protein
MFFCQIQTKWGLFVENLLNIIPEISIDPVVSEEKIEMWSVQMTDRRQKLTWPFKSGKPINILK